MYIHYGCGHVAPPQWQNFDASPTLWWERLPLIGLIYTKNGRRFPANVRYGNIVNGLPIPDEQCDGVYASHVLEHLTLSEFRTALINTKRMLRRGGIFRLVVPDLSNAADQYLRRLASGDEGASEFFMTATNLGQIQRPRGIVGAAYELLGRSQHRWMWDEVSLGAELRRAGFVAVRRCEPGDCEDVMFSQVEDKGRFADAVGMESKR